jgi:hypothetical protein
MKALIYLGSIFSIIFLLFYFFASGDNAPVYQLASKIIGRPPSDGDGAFQFPLGWIILLILGSGLGLVVGYLIEKYLIK